MAKRTRSSKELESTAYHEAGHAVVHVHFGLPINRISIVPDDDAYGWCTHAPPLLFDGSTRERRRIARSMIISSYAGLAAQRLVDHQADESGAEQDEAGAFDLSREYGVCPNKMSFIGDEFHFRYLDKLRREAERLVQQLQPSIELLAQALLAAPDGTLAGEEVEDLLGDDDR